MERSLFGVACILGGLVWLCGALLGRMSRSEAKPPPSSLPKMIWGAVVALPILGFIVTLPSNPPLFAAGHGLGTGLLIGGLAAALAYAFSLSSIEASGADEPPNLLHAVVSPISLGFAVVVLPSIFLRNVVTDALSGVAIGWLMTAAILFAATSLTLKKTHVSALQLSLALTTGIVCLFTAFMTLGELKGVMELAGKAGAVAVHWSAPAAIFSVLAILIFWVFSLPKQFALRLPLVSTAVGYFQSGASSESEGERRVNRLVLAISSLLILIVGKIVASRFALSGEKPTVSKNALVKALYGVLGHSQILHIVLIGVVVGLLIRWVFLDANDRDKPGDSACLKRSLFPASVVMIFGSMISFLLLGGFGMALMLCASLPIFLVSMSLEIGAKEGADAVKSSSNLLFESFARVLFFGILLDFYRLFSVLHLSDLRGVALTDQYAIFCLLLGAMFPGALSVWRNSFRQTSSSTGVASASDSLRTLLQLALVGVVLLAAPALLMAILGIKALLPLIAGLAFGAIIADTGILTCLLSLALALAITQFTSHILPLTELTRDKKLVFVIQAGVVVAVLCLVNEFVERSKRRNFMPNAPAESEGGKP